MWKLAITLYSTNMMMFLKIFHFILNLFQWIVYKMISFRKITRFSFKKLVYIAIVKNQRILRNDEQIGIQILTVLCLWYLLPFACICMLLVRHALSPRQRINQINTEIWTLQLRGLWLQYLAMQQGRRSVGFIFNGRL